jgi:DNA helicase-2/ATP-dependent DNA helicase PcrA
MPTAKPKPKPAPMPPSPRPAARPISSPSPTPPPASGSGNFTIHTIDELSVRSEILHQRFGRGTVTDIDTSGDPKIDVAFHDGQTRKLLLKFAKFEIL